MQITYDTELDSVSSPQLNAEQTRELQAQLVRALALNTPVREVASGLLATAKRMSADSSI